ncbi:MAG: hypothetical protein ACRCUX_07205, partial [Beijerinckiaceae bacterium]
DGIKPFAVIEDKIDLSAFGGLTLGDLNFSAVTNVDINGDSVIDITSGVLVTSAAFGTDSFVLGSTTMAQTGSINFIF